MMESCVAPVVIFDMDTGRIPGRLVDRRIIAGIPQPPAEKLIALVGRTRQYSVEIILIFNWVI